MENNRTPESTQELPISSAESFAKFILEEREGELNASHLHMIYMMQCKQLMEDGLLPESDKIAGADKEKLEGLVLEAADFANDMLPKPVDEMGAWTGQFESQSDLEVFIENQSEIFSNRLSELIGGKNG